MIEEVRRCGFALEILKTPQVAFVENLGSIINTPEEETKPVYSPNFQERVYFSSARPGSTGAKEILPDYSMKKWILFRRYVLQWLYKRKLVRTNYIFAFAEYT